MRVFVIAPTHANLPDVTIEISAIDRRHQAVILRGHVRDQDIAEKLDGQTFDVVWWISHGNAEGILLSDGLLSIGGVRQYLRTSGARLGVLNTCESENVARSIAIGGNADMICTIGEIDNKDAVRLGSLLAVELGKTDDFRTAYQVIDPDDGTYKYIRARAAVSIATRPDSRKRLMPDEATELRQAIDNLRQSMNTSTVTMAELRGTMSMNNALTKQSMDALSDQFTVFRAQFAARAPAWVAYATLIFMAVIALGVTVMSIVWIYQR